MFKKLKGFTLVEALVILTVLAILLAATTRLITRKVLSAPEKNMHGRYEAYYDNDGKARYTYFNGSGKIVREEKCKDKADDGIRAICIFNPPETAENFHIQAVGGGGAGGSAGGSGTNDGSGSATVANGAPTHDANYGKYKTRPNNTTPFNQYFDLRAYNENNEVVGAPGTQARNGTSSRNPDDTVNRSDPNESNRNANRFKVGVLQNKDFYGTFPAATQWPKVLGSSKIKPDYSVKVPNWFDWDAIASDPEVTGSIGKIGKGKIGDFEVVASACSGASGEGGDLHWNTTYDYDYLRNKYVTYSRTTSSGKYCCKRSCRDGGCCSSSTYCTTTRKCNSSNTTYYTCAGSSSSTETEDGACGGSCPGNYDYMFATRTNAEHLMTMIGSTKGEPTPLMPYASLDTGRKYACAMLHTTITSGLSGSAVLTPESSTQKFSGVPKMAMAETAKPSPWTFPKNGEPNNTSTNDYSGYGGPSGSYGTTGIVTLTNGKTISNSSAAEVTANGGRSHGACQDWVCDVMPLDFDKCADNGGCCGRWHCSYDFSGKVNNTLVSGGTCGRRISCSGEFLIGHEGKRYPPNGTPGLLNPSGAWCNNDINGRNYCRTGLYNHEYSYEMARGYKQLSYGDRGETGKFETKTVGQINEPIKITLGKGGEWDPDVKHKKWNEDVGSHGPSGSETIVGSLLTVAGGAGGKGALKTDKYELCSIFDKEHCKFPNNPPGLARLSPNYQYFRIQEGTKGEASKIELLHSNSAPKTPGKGGNGFGTISTREFICNARAVYNLMTTTGSVYTSAFKYNGYVIFQAFRQELPSGSADSNLCATQTEVGNKYLIELDSGGYKMGADVKSALKTELRGHDAAVIITW